MLKYSESPLSQPPYLELFQSRGGPVEAFFGGASLETFSGEAQLKNHPVHKHWGGRFSWRKEAILKWKKQSTEKYQSFHRFWSENSTIFDRKLGIFVKGVNLNYSLSAVYLCITPSRPSVRRQCEYDSKADCEIEGPPTFQHCCRRNLRPPNQTRSQTRVKNLVIQDTSYKQFKEHDDQGFIMKNSCTSLLTC